MKIRYSWIMVWLLTVAPSLMAGVSVDRVIGGKVSLLGFYKKEFEELFRECKYSKEKELRDQIAGLKGKFTGIRRKGSVYVHNKAMREALSIKDKKAREEAVKAAKGAYAKRPSKATIMNTAKAISIQESNLRKLERLKADTERIRKSITNVQDAAKLNKGYCSLAKIASDFSNLSAEVRFDVNASGRYKTAKSGQSMQALGGNIEKTRSASLADFMRMMQGGKRKSKTPKKRKYRKSASGRIYSRKEATKVVNYHRHAKEKKARLLQCMLVLTDQAVDAPEDFFPVGDAPAKKDPESAGKIGSQFHKLDSKPPSSQKIKDDIGNLELVGESARSALVLLEKALRNMSRFSESSEKAPKGNTKIAKYTKRIKWQWASFVRYRYSFALLLSESCKLLESQKENTDPIVVSRIAALGQLRRQFKNSMGLYLTHWGLQIKTRENHLEEYIREKEKEKRQKEKQQK